MKTGIEARFVGLAAKATLPQIFVNACCEPVEVVYLFPWPPSALMRPAVCVLVKVTPSPRLTHFASYILNRPASF